MRRIRVSYLAAPLFDSHINKQEIYGQIRKSITGRRLTGGHHTSSISHGSAEEDCHLSTRSLGPKSQLDRECLEFSFLSKSLCHLFAACSLLYWQRRTNRGHEHSL